MKLEESKTFENLAAAFATECQARTRYEYIEYGARFNGYKALAEMIDKMAYQEFTHSRMLYAAIQQCDLEQVDNIEISGGFPFKEKWDVCQNLMLASDDEQQDAKAYEMYIKIAEDEGFRNEAELFKMIRKVELRHSKVFKYLHNKMKDGNLYKADKEVKWVCPDCGHVHFGFEAPQECALCKAKQGTFEICLPEEFYCCD